MMLICLPLAQTDLVGALDPAAIAEVSRLHRLRFPRQPTFFFVCLFVCEANAFNGDSR